MILCVTSKVMHEVVNLILAEGNKGVSTLKACINVAELVQAEVRPVSMFIRLMMHVISDKRCVGLPLLRRLSMHTRQAFMLDVCRSRT